MADRELLEQAAKAAGLEWLAFNEEVERRMYVRELGVSGCAWFWDPLTDDGDALRLAVRLGIDIFGSVDARFCEWGGGTTSEPCGNDPDAAQRRAIVRAAAEIGRAMPEKSADPAAGG
jgi:hypothetical protein